MILSFRGKLKAGKSTLKGLVAELLQAKGMRVQYLSFAEPLKVEVYDWWHRIANTEYYYDSQEAWDADHDILAAFVKARGEEMRGLKSPNLLIPVWGDILPQEKVDWVNQNKDSLRPILQWWGTDYRRSQDENYWVKQLDAQVDDSLVNMIDDCRFPNEYAVLKTHAEFYDILVQRPGFDGDGHASETSLPPSEFVPDYIIQNDSNMDDLRAKACNLVESILF